MTARRQVVNVPGVERTHSPIPEGAKIGDLLFSSLLSPSGEVSRVPGQDTLPAAHSLFGRIRALLEAAGGSAENVADLAVYVMDDEDRNSINVAWSELFSDAADRPSRHILNVAPKGIGGALAANFVAVIPDRRLGESDIGKVVYSPLISGRAPGTNELPPDPDRQAELMWDNVKRWVEGQGGTINSIGNVMIYTMNNAYREVVNKPWAKMFPDRDNLPARETINVEPNGLKDECFACLVTAVL